MRTLLLASLMFPSAAFAATVTIDPGAYEGQYALQGRWVTGIQTADFDEGNHGVSVGTLTGVWFDVAADGTVTVDPRSTTQATASGSTLTLETVPLTIDRATCDSWWSMSRVVGPQSSQSGTVDVVPGRYGVNAGTGVLFSIDELGDITVESPYEDRVTTSGSTLTFVCNPLNIEIGTYTEDYVVGGAFTDSGRLRVDSSRDVSVGSHPIVYGAYNRAYIDVAADGSISYGNPFGIVTPEDAISISGDTVSFLNHDVPFDVSGAETVWLIWQTQYRLGDDTLSLPTGRYRINTTGWDRFFFQVDPAGVLSIEEGGEDYATSDGSTISFNTETIVVEPETESTSWRLNGTVTYTGTQEVVLPVGSHAVMGQTKEISRFSVSSPCELDKALVYDQNGRAFALSCAEDDPSTVDSDGDGVPDAFDACEGYDDALDDDADGVPDDCDLCEGDDDSGDTDADGICDTSDNCPLDDNADQADADGDDLGDVCEADTDGDGVIDDDDNCPDEANADQADNELDGIGDVCDVDDDDDGVVDDIDVCPLVEDADQTDTDGDGQGDACDGDDDGDGVLDEDDLCPGTPLTMAIDDDGCSGSQYVALTCEDVCDFVNEGQYVKCVTQATNEAKDAGLLTGSEKGAIVRLAAKDECEE